jgi:hypothetical protein
MFRSRAADRRRFLVRRPRARWLLLGGRGQGSLRGRHFQGPRVADGLKLHRWLIGEPARQRRLLVGRINEKHAGAAGLGQRLPQRTIVVAERRGLNTQLTEELSPQRFLDACERVTRQFQTSQVWPLCGALLQIDLEL